MKETRYFYVPNAETAKELPEEEALHANRVLRMKEGDEMMLMDGKGSFYQATVSLANNKHCFFDIVQALPQERQWKGRVHLAIAPTKMMDRIEWLVEKATEVGVDDISFLDCRFSERRAIKLQRVEKIVISAAKQSRKAYMPEVHDMEDFKSFIARHQEGKRFIAHCYDEVERVNLFECLKQGEVTEDLLVLIGPEGDFSIDEVRMAVDAGFVSVDLGKSRLRTETAGLAAVMMMQLSK